MRLRALAAVLLLWLPATALAQTYPARPIRLVVPWPPGGLTDIPARLVAEHMSRTLGQSIVIDNKPGASGQIGSESVKPAAPDGYTLLYANAATHGALPALKRGLSYRALEDFTPVILCVVSPFALVVRGDSEIRSLEDLIGHARRQGRATFGTTGNGSIGHLLALLMTRSSGAVFEPVAYRGDTPAIQDLLAGNIDLHYLAVAKQYTDGGQLRAVATTGDRRWFVYPDVPTLVEKGIAHADLVGWNGIVAPAGTPPAVIARLNAAGSAALADATVRERLMQVGLEPAGGPPEQFGRFMAGYVDRIQEIGQSHRIEID